MRNVAIYALCGKHKSAIKLLSLFIAVFKKLALINQNDGF